MTTHRLAPAALTTTLLALALGTTAPVAHAGECAAGAAAHNALAGAPTMPVGVTDVELSSIDLAPENVHLEHRRLRVRRMTIAPGGIVPLHSHEDRPALIRVDRGEVLEHASGCAQPIVHRAGDVAREHLGTMHWWNNPGPEAVELTIADIVNDGAPASHPEKM